MRNIHIKKVNQNELKQLQYIGKKTFAETFSAHNTEKDMNLYLKEEFSEARLTQELNDKNTAFYFAIIKKK
jgi:hypothetical protein